MIAKFMANCTIDRQHTHLRCLDLELWSLDIRRELLETIGI